MRAILLRNADALGFLIVRLPSLVTPLYMQALVQPFEVCNMAVGCFAVLQTELNTMVYLLLKNPIHRITVIK